MSTEEKSVTHKYEKKGKFNVKLNFFDRDDNDNTDTSFVLIGEGKVRLRWRMFWLTVVIRLLWTTFAAREFPGT